MARNFRVLITDFNGGRQDLTAYADPDNAQLHQPNGVSVGESMLPLKFTESQWLGREFDIQAGMEIWAGDYDDDGFWYPKNLFGGYIRLPEMGKIRGMERLLLHLFTYDVLLDRKVVTSFPDPFVLTTVYHSPPDPTSDVPISGYPVDHSLREWLVRDTDPKGLIPTFLPDYQIDLEGMNNGFALLTYFDISGRPSNTAVLGHLEGLTLSDAIEMIISMGALVAEARYGNHVKPAKYMKAIPRVGHEDEVVPQLVVLDLNSVEVSDLVFSDEPEGSEVGEWWGYNNVVDATNMYKRIIIIGKGAVQAGFDVFTHQKVWKRVYYLNSNFADNDPPTPRYRALNEAELLIRDDDITTMEAAQALGDRLAQTLHDGRETITFTTSRAVERGTLIRIRHQSTMGIGTDGKNYPVIDVTAEVDNREWVYHVTAGWPKLTAQDVTGGNFKTLLGIYQAGVTVNRGAGGPNFFNPAVQAKLAAKYGPLADTVNAIKTKTATNRPSATGLFTTPDGQLIDPADTNNFVSAAIPPPPRRPVPGTTPIAAPIATYYNEDGDLVEWQDQSNYNHPYHHTYSDLVADDTFTLPLPDMAAFISTLIVTSELDGAGEFVDPPGVGVSLSLKILDSGGVSTVYPGSGIDQDHPLTIYRADKQIALIMAGANGTSKYGIVVSELIPSPLLFGYAP